MSDHTSTQELSQNVPYGYCHCGCGQLAPLSDRTDRARGYVKGEPMNFARHHGLKGARKYASLEEAFWARCPSQGPILCWEWAGAKSDSGYGVLRYSKLLYAHRVSWELHFGPIPEGLNACHHCDNPPCCNPYHLFLGTHADNHADMDDKGRGVSNFTKDQVLYIRQQVASGYSQTLLADEFGVARSTISRIVNGETWRRVK